MRDDLPRPVRLAAPGTGAAPVGDRSEVGLSTADLVLRRMDSSPIPDRFTRPHRHDLNEIMIVRSGRSRHTVDGHAVDLRAGTICFLPRGHMHWLDASSRVVGWLVQFSDDFLPADLVSRRWNYLTTLTGRFEGRRALEIGTTELDRIELMMELMEEQYLTPSPLQAQALRHWLSILVIRIGRLGPHPAVDGDRTGTDLDLFHRFSAALERDFTRHHDVRYYATGLGTTPVTLTRSVVNVVGKPTKRVIEDRIVLEARRMLMYGEQTVREIALHLGYTDQFHFSKRFKRLVGMTPTEFRALTLTGRL